MNNIDILEEFCKIKINSYAIKFVNISYPELQQAIETLISENKELKEIVETLRKENVEAMIQKRQYELHYIPKSKVEEKIKDLKENNNGDDYNLTNVIMILQSLLGKE